MSAPVVIASLEKLKSGFNGVKRAEEGTIITPGQGKLLTQSQAQQLPFPPQARGMEVKGTAPGYGAAQAGLQVGDVIISMNGTPIQSSTEAEAALSRFPVGSEALILFFRNNQLLKAKVLLLELLGQ